MTPPDVKYYSCCGREKKSRLGQMCSHCSYRLSALKLRKDLQGLPESKLIDMVRAARQKTAVIKHHRSRAISPPSRMIPCNECGVHFFTPEGRAEHDNYCIGYNPATKTEGELQKQKALKTASPGLRPIGVRI